MESKSDDADDADDADCNDMATMSQAALLPKKQAVRVVKCEVSCDLRFEPLPIPC